MHLISFKSFANKCYTNLKQQIIFRRMEFPFVNFPSSRWQTRKMLIIQSFRIPFWCIFVSCNRWQQKKNHIKTQIFFFAKHFHKTLNDKGCLKSEVIKKKEEKEVDKFFCCQRFRDRVYRSLFRKKCAVFNWFNLRIECAFSHHEANSVSERKKNEKHTQIQRVKNPFESKTRERQRMMTLLLLVYSFIWYISKKCDWLVKMCFPPHKKKNWIYTLASLKLSQQIESCMFIWMVHCIYDNWHW